MAAFHTCAEINLDHLEYNYKQIKGRAATHIIPVVKANAYGHGAVAVVKRLLHAGHRGLFAVAQLQEALEIRESGIDAPILIFGRLFPGQIKTAAAAGFRMTLFCSQDISWIEREGLDQLADVHVNVDTGMGRVGVLPDHQNDFFNALARSKAIRWEGLYSHFATSDEEDKTYANQQLERFSKLLNHIARFSQTPDLIHMANSGAILDIPASHFQAVRPGIILYGHYPSSETSTSMPIKQVMSFKSYVAHLRNIPAGFSVSYGCRWTSAQPTTLAVVPVGYADGVVRRLTGCGQVAIKGKRYPIVGTVTMDHIMIDIGSDSIDIGDEVVLWGQAGSSEIQALEVADQIGTIPYELTCGVSRRVRRLYVSQKGEEAF